MASKVGICNFALGHLGLGKEIANFETEKSQEAASCRLYYETALKQTLRDYDWPFATKIAALNLIEETPNVEWGYSYRYPTDCVKFRRILSGVRIETRTQRVPLKIAKDSAGRIIFTDRQEAEGEYTEYVTNPALYPEDFTMALSLRLAAYIAPRVTAGDPYKLAERATRLYLAELGMAEATSGNEEQTDPEPDSEMISGRE